MFIIIPILSVIAFSKTVSYAIFEIKKNSNILGGVSLIAISIVSLVLPTIMVFFRGTC